MIESDIVVSFEHLPTADLHVGAIYRGGAAGNAGDDPLDKLLHCGNMGGFRFRGSEQKGYDLVVLYTTFEDPEWPDRLESKTGRFVYYGDNKRPGQALHETPKGGNALLRACFEQVHVQPARREHVPPFFVFSSQPHGRDARFEGLAAPGALDLTEDDDLVASWKTRGTERFQNYRATFTILESRSILREWLARLVEGDSGLALAPEAWRQWVEEGVYRPLTS